MKKYLQQVDNEIDIESKLQEEFEAELEKNYIEMLTEERNGVM